MVRDPDSGDGDLGTSDPLAGSLFANLVLAEDMHSAAPMVRNALVSAMEERRVSILDEVLRLPDPFLVVATMPSSANGKQSPLTEAQADRFLMQVELAFPDSEEEREIIDVSGNGRRGHVVREVLLQEELLRARRVVVSVYADRMIKDYAVALVAATRGSERPAAEEVGPDRETASTSTAHGASPRATVDLIRAARAQAFLMGRGYVTPQDVKAVAPDVLRHRLELSSRAVASGITVDGVVRGILDTVAVP
jgi:MoxR-like ATPase